MGRTRESLLISLADTGIIIQNLKSLNDFPLIVLAHLYNMSERQFKKSVDFDGEVQSVVKTS